MEDFSFVSPTRFILERGAERHSGMESARYSDKVLLVYYKDSFMTESGLYDRVLTSLKDAGAEVFEISDVEPNPRLGPVYNGIRICRENGIGFILAVGGGSVIDTAKAIALGAGYENDVWDFFTGAAAPQKALPIGAVMTIPATGSEASNGSVITNEKTGEKRDVMGDLLRPAFVLMNPEITFTLPAKQTAFGIADMFSHVTERYFSNSREVQVTDRLCEGMMKAIIECGIAAMDAPKDYEARANLMWASILAHNGLLGTGRNQDWSTHMMAAAVGGEYDTAHGALIAVLLPAWAEYVMDGNIPRFAQFANRVFDVDIDFGDQSRTAREGIRRLREFFARLGLAGSLRELGIDSADKFDMLADRACFGGTIGCMKSLSAGDIRAIFDRAF